MLDAYIIDRIRREREAEDGREGNFVPLRIEVPRPPMGPQIEEERPEENERGSVIIDFNL